MSVGVLLALLVAAALASLGSRLLIANIDHFRSTIERQLDNMGVRGFSVDRVTGQWHGLSPVLTLRGAALSVPGRSQALHVDELGLSVNLLDSLLQRDLKIDAVRARVTKLILVKDAEGRWWLNDMRLFGGDGGGSGFNFYAMFQRLPEYVAIDVGLIQIRDRAGGRDFLIQRSQLRSHLIGERLDLYLNSLLPAPLGTRLEARFSGDAGQQRFYLQADQVNPVAIADLVGFAQPVVVDSRLSFESWATLKDFELQALTTRVPQATAKLRNGERESATIRFAADQKIVRDGTAWRVDSHFKRASYRQQGLPAFFSTAYFSPAESGPVFAIDRLDVGQLVPVISDLLPEDSAGRLLSEASPAARLFNLILRIDPEDPLQSALRFEFEGLQANPAGALPGIDRLSGWVTAARGRLAVSLPEQPLELNFKTLFRQPLGIERFSAAVQATINDGETLISVNDLVAENSDLALDGRAWFEIQHGRRPFMSLRLAYRDGNAAMTSKYLPVSIMPPATVRWLDDSIKGGVLSQGGLLFHGRLNYLSIFDDEQSGVFHALFDVRHPEVDFLPGWPRAHGGQGRASFHNTSMRLNFEGVSLASSVVDRVEVSIADFLRARLDIAGDTRGDAASVLETLTALPVIEVADLISQRQDRTGGRIRTRVDIGIPLHHDPSEVLTVKARAELDKVSLRIPDWLVDFSRVDGVVEINDGIVSASALTGDYAGDPVTLDISTNPTAGTTEFELDGSVSTGKLLGHAPDYIRKPVSGKSPWQVKVSVGHSPRVAQNLLLIKAESALEGTAIDAPEPLQLAPDEVAPLSFDASLSFDNAFRFSARLGDRLLARARLVEGARQSLELDYLDLTFGTGKPVLKDNGVNLAGSIQRLDIDAWQQFQQSQLPRDAEPSELLPHIKTIELAIDELSWQGRDVHKLKLNVRNRGDRLSGDIDSSLARGVFEMPFVNGQGRPLSGDFDYIRLGEKRGEGGERMRLEDMPNLDIKSRSLAYDDMEFSDFALRTAREPDRFVIQQLDLRRDEVKLEASGHWQYSPQIDKHVTVFNLNVKGPRFGSAISNLGLGDSIRNGVIDFEGQIGWAGSLFDINWPSLIGEVSLSLKDGYLNNVEPGAGRFVGLLSLNALPKRLFLDFGDVLQEGMQFDEIRGTFTIKGELMTTDDATMEGASARVELQGDTNLRRKTYDQHMVIVPKVGETLPVLGSLAAGNAVGWGLLLIQKIFKKPIEKSVQIEYTMTGSWDDPQLTLVSKPEPEEAESDILNDF